MLFRSGGIAIRKAVRIGIYTGIRAMTKCRAGVCILLGGAADGTSIGGITINSTGRIGINTLVPGMCSRVFMGFNPGSTADGTGMSGIGIFLAGVGRINAVIVCLMDRNIRVGIDAGQRKAILRVAYIRGKPDLYRITGDRDGCITELSVVVCSNARTVAIIDINIIIIFFCFGA